MTLDAERLDDPGVYVEGLHHLEVGMPLLQVLHHGQLTLESAVEESEQGQGYGKQKRRQ